MELNGDKLISAFAGEIGSLRANAIVMEQQHAAEVEKYQKELKDLSDRVADLERQLEAPQTAALPTTGDDSASPSGRKSSYGM